jgi:hypothetical protein
LSPADEFAAAEKRAIEVGLDHSVEFLCRPIGDTCSATARAGIIDQGCRGCPSSPDTASNTSVRRNHVSSACRLHLALALFGAGLRRCGK